MESREKIIVENRYGKYQCFNNHKAYDENNKEYGWDMDRDFNIRIYSDIDYQPGTNFDYAKRIEN